MSEPLWPELSWTPAGEPIEWLLDRTHQMNVRARSFALALQQAVEVGDVQMARLSDVTNAWEELISQIWKSSGLESAEEVRPEDVPSRAKDLAKVYRALVEKRQSILDQLGADGSAKLEAREISIDVEARQEAEAFPEPQQFGGDVDLLGNQLPFFELPTQEFTRPVSIEELRMRQAAENKLLPESGNLGALLAILPSEWVSSIYETLGFAAPDFEGVTSGSRSSVRRGVIHEHLHREEFLRDLVAALAPDERRLLEELVEAGRLPYQRVTADYGKDDADGFFWSDRTPSGPLGRLRRMGLAFVATRMSQLTVQTPVDLQEKLKAALQPAGEQREEPGEEEPNESEG